MKHIQIMKLFSNVITVKESLFDDVHEKGEDCPEIWILAIRIENNKIYQMYSAGEYINPHAKVEWENATGLDHPDAEYMNKEAKSADRETECHILEGRGWTLYAFENDQEMFDIAHILRDFFHSTVLPNKGEL